MTLGESIKKLKNECKNSNYNYIMTNHAYCIDKYTSLYDIIQKMEVPELIGESESEKTEHSNKA
tara:strand:- start:4314 stop:4505 length:192 start_codon:yes stop_codon:yes gene_type:complete